MSSRKLNPYQKQIMNIFNFRITKSLTIVFSLLFSVVIFVNNTLAAPGDFDSSFGNGGKVIYRISDREDSFHTVAIQPDNKIVVAGKNGGNNLIVMRYNTNGAIDTSFASNGVFTLSSFSQSYGNAVVLQNDGKIVVTGFTNLGVTDSAYLVVRLNTNGTLDNTFGSSGVVTTI